MRALRDPDVEAWGYWFSQTHEVEVMGMTAVWKLIRLPASGAVEDQEARLMTALRYYRQVANALLRTQQRTATAEQELRQFMDQERVH